MNSVRSHAQAIFNLDVRLSHVFFSINWTFSCAIIASVTIHEIKIVLCVILKSDSHLPKEIVLFASLNAFKNDERYVLFHLKSAFRSQDI